MLNNISSLLTKVNVRRQHDINGSIRKDITTESEDLPMGVKKINTPKKPVQCQWKNRYLGPT